VGKTTSFILSVTFTFTALPLSEPNHTVKTTPVGPVAGGIMGCFLVLALGVYCYRHHIHRNSHQYITNLPENPNRMSHYYEEETEPSDEPGSGKLLSRCNLIVC